MQQPLIHALERVLMPSIYEFFCLESGLVMAEAQEEIHEGSLPCRDMSKNPTSGQCKLL